MPTPVNRDERDVSKQMTTYADGIAALSSLQAIAFVYGVGGGSPGLGPNVHNHPYITCVGIVLGFAAYWYLLTRCHWNEDNLTGEPEKSNVGRAVKETRRHRHRYSPLFGPHHSSRPYGRIPTLYKQFPSLKPLVTRQIVWVRGEVRGWTVPPAQST
jgi:hypothetical protein